MCSIDILLQAEGLADIAVVRASPHDTIADMLGKADCDLLKGKEVYIFLEDVPAPLDTDAVVEELLPLAANEEINVGPLRLHLCRCRRVEVSVRFNGENVTRRFGPSTTVERVRRWAARRAFDLPPHDAAEHVLQIQDSTTRPDRDLHIGTIISGKACAVAFDLVPFKRVEG